MKNSPTTLTLLWLAALLSCGWWLSQQIHLRADLALFLPAGDTREQQLLLSELQQGRATRILLLGISGGDAGERAALSQSLLGVLRESGLFQRVENGTPGEFEIDQRLFDYRFLLNPAEASTERFSAPQLRSSLEARLQELQSPLPNPLKSLMPRDPTGRYADMLKAWLSQSQVARSAGVWSSRAGDLAMLIVETRESGLDIDQQARGLETIQEAFQRLDESGRYQLIVSGPAAFGHLSKQIIEGESRRLSLAASMAIAVLLFLAYRYLPYLLYAALPLLSGLLLSTLVSGWIFGELHGITLAFGMTLLGVTLDYPVHLFSHLRPGEPPAQTMRGLWGTLRLGVLTTCLGYLALVTTAFDGLQQLGVFTLIGLLTAALCSRYLLPRLFPAGFVPARIRGVRLLASLAASRRRWPVPAGLAVAALAGASLFSNQPLWNDDIAVLSPLPAKALAEDRLLRQQLNVEETNQMILLQGEDTEQLLQRCESLRPVIASLVAQGYLDGASLPCDFLPSQTRQRQLAANLPTTDLLTDQLRQALEGLPFRAGVFNGFIEDVEASRSLPPLSYGMTEGTPLRALLEPMLRERQDGWLALLPLHQVNDPQSIAKRLDSDVPGVRYLNLRVETSQMIGEFRAEILRRVLLGGLVMLAVLWLGLKSLPKALQTLLPIALALLLTVSLLRLLGESMNLFHLISLMLVLGIGIDYSLFFSRPSNLLQERVATLHALALCALSTLGVFAILATSKIPVLHAIGLTVAIGVSMSFLATYTLSRSAPAVPDEIQP